MTRLSSASIEIRDAIKDRIATIYNFKKVRTQPNPIMQESDLPCLTIVIAGEKMTPDGDGNAGYPHFETEVVIGISVALGYSDIPTLDHDVDCILNEIESTLFCDPTFVQKSETGLFEAISQVARQRIFPDEGSTYLAEARLEITFVAREDYQPDFATAPDFTFQMKPSNAPST